MLLRWFFRISTLVVIIFRVWDGVFMYEYNDVEFVAGREITYIARINSTAYSSCPRSSVGSPI